MTISYKQACNLLEQYDPGPTPYTLKHLQRFVTTVGFLPQGQGRLLELGCDNYFSMLLRHFTQYQVQTANLPAGGAGYSKTCQFVHKSTGEVVQFARDQFNLEFNRFPYPDNTFDVIVCAEVIEHLLHDPMAMLIESQRVLRPGGTLVLTTPNLLSWHAVCKAIKGLSPFEFSCFLRSYSPPLLQHAKEYMVEEIIAMLCAAGFSVEKLTTPYFLHPEERFGLSEWFLLALVFAWYPISGRHPKLLRHRGPHIFALARKAEGPIDRFPPLIYST